MDNYTQVSLRNEPPHFEIANQMADAILSHSFQVQNEIISIIANRISEHRHKEREVLRLRLGEIDQAGIVLISFGENDLKSNAIQSSK